MAKYHGREGAVYLAASSGGAATAVANLSGWSLTIDQALAEVTCLATRFLPMCMASSMRKDR